MTKNALVMLAVLSLGAPACVVTTTTRDVGSLNADGTVYLGWNLVGGDNKTGANDQDTYYVGQQVGAFSAIRLHSEKPISVAQVLVVFADGERWIAPVPAQLGNDQWTAPIPLPRGPRAIHSIVVFGRSTAALLSRLEIHGTR
ncbi:MAG: hypothetical protein ACXVEF_18305 [Polyangiales bacterium]